MITRQVIRGERPVTDLALISVHMRSEQIGPAVRHTQHSASGATVDISARDLAAGLLIHHTDAAALQAWATVLLVHDAFVVPEDWDDDEDFAVLWDAVWDASFTGKVRDEAVSLAQRIA